jgi:hypothetical protein
MTAANCTAILRPLAIRARTFWKKSFLGKKTLDCAFFFFFIFRGVARWLPIVLWANVSELADEFPLLPPAGKQPRARCLVKTGRSWQVDHSFLRMVLRMGRDVVAARLARRLA